VDLEIVSNKKTARTDGVSPERLELLRLAGSNDAAGEPKKL
jgi:hypothetical protein